MIRLHGRSYDLPAELMVCPVCRAAHLTWDGRWAWRCSHSVVKRDGTIGRCRYGLALSALFDDDNLDAAFVHGRNIDIRRLELSGYALKLVRLGLIHIDWLDETEAAARLNAWQADHGPDDDPDPEEALLDDLGRLMRDHVRE